MFKTINENLIKRAIDALASVSKIQKEMGANNDEFVGRVQEAKVAKELGFKLQNADKHGIDAKFSDDTERYVEVKNATYDGKTPSATFNDTTIEKANLFKEPNMWLALGVWRNLHDLLFICYVSNPNIGDFLEKRVNSFLDGNGVRSTQSIPLTTLLEEYDAKILPVSATSEEICSMLGGWVFPHIVDSPSFDGDSASYDDLSARLRRNAFKSRLVRR